MLYQIKDGTVSAGGQTILSHVDFYIKEKEKIFAQSFFISYYFVTFVVDIY